MYGAKTKVFAPKLDKGFDYPEPHALAEEFRFTLHLRTRGEAIKIKRHASIA